MKFCEALIMDITHENRSAKVSFDVYVLKCIFAKYLIACLLSLKSSLKDNRCLIIGKEKSSIANKGQYIQYIVLSLQICFFPSFPFEKMLLSTRDLRWLETILKEKKERDCVYFLGCFFIFVTPEWRKEGNLKWTTRYILFINELFVLNNGNLI